MAVELLAPVKNALSSPTELHETYTRQAFGLIQIKPKVIFMKIEASDPAPVSMKINVPSSDIGSVTLLEAATLVSLVKLVRPRKVFEFGTFLGYSTSLLVENSADNCLVYSLDLGEGHEGGKPLDAFDIKDLHSDGDINDEFLRGAQGVRGPHYTSALSSSDRTRLRLLQADSRRFDPTDHDLAGSVDIVFVDGGHDTATVTIDTANARKMIGESGVIVWHDFNSGIHSDVTSFLGEVAKHEVIIWIQHTMLAILLVGKAGQDLLKIGA